MKHAPKGSSEAIFLESCVCGALGELANVDDRGGQLGDLANVDDRNGGVG